MSKPSRVGEIRLLTRTAITAGALLLLSVARAVTQVDAGFEPVPAANISEWTLSVPEENFSMRAPGPEWEWLRDKAANDSAGRSYLCRNLRTGERFQLTVTPPGMRAAKYAEDWLARIKTTQEAQGRELVGPRSEPSDVPAPGSLRLATMITAPRTTIYFTGYVTGADRVYAFQHYSDASKESPVFNAFARSFALLNPAAPPSGGFLGRYGVVVGVAGGLVLLLLVSRMLGRGGKTGRARRR
jgi:hypothetical protein